MDLGRLLRLSQAGPMAILFAASHPDRTKALVLYATFATPRKREDYPRGRSRLDDRAWKELLG